MIGPLGRQIAFWTGVVLLNWSALFWLFGGSLDLEEPRDLGDLIVAATFMTGAGVLTLLVGRRKRAIAGGVSPPRLVVRRLSKLRSLTKGPLILALAIFSTACVGEGSTPTPGQDSSTTVAPAGIEGSTSSSTSTTELVTTTSPITAAEELEAAILAAEETDCFFENATRDILAQVDDDMGAQDMGLYGDSEGVSYVLSGLVGIRFAGPSWWPFTTASSDLAKIHAQLFFNHQRTVASLDVFLDRPVEVWIDGTGDPLVNPPENVIAVWDGFEIAYSDGDTISFPAVGPLRDPDAQLAVSQEARLLVWERIDAWVTELLGVIDTQPDPLWHAVRGLEDGGLSTSMVPLLCVALATEWSISDNESSATLLEELRNDPSIFFSELAVQELLLATEYLQIIEEHLSQPDVDWFRAADVDESQAVDGVTSSSEYVVLWHQAALHVLNRYRILVRDARPLVARKTPGLGSEEDLVASWNTVVSNGPANADLEVLHLEDTDLVVAGDQGVEYGLTELLSFRFVVDPADGQTLFIVLSSSSPPETGAEMAQLLFSVIYLIETTNPDLPQSEVGAVLESLGFPPEEGQPESTETVSGDIRYVLRFDPETLIVIAVHKDAVIETE